MVGARIDILHNRKRMPVKGIGFQVEPEITVDAFVFDGPDAFLTPRVRYKKRIHCRFLCQDQNMAPRLHAGRIVQDENVPAGLYNALFPERMKGFVKGCIGRVIPDA